MAPKFTLSDWDIGDELAIYYRLEDGWLVMHAFAMTRSGVVDLVAFRSEPCSLADAGALADRVQSICDDWHIEPEPDALTSRRLRVQSSTGASLTEARRHLSKIAAVQGWTTEEQVDRTKLADLARFVLDYSAELEQGPGGRARIALKLHLTEDAIKARIRRAAERGLWTTSGVGGRAGQPSQLAYEIAQEEQ